MMNHAIEGLPEWQLSQFTRSENKSYTAQYMRMYVLP